MPNFNHQNLSDIYKVDPFYNAQVQNLSGNTPFYLNNYSNKN